jgi:hypothetical protein
MLSGQRGGIRAASPPAARPAEPGRIPASKQPSTAGSAVPPTAELPLAAGASMERSRRRAVAMHAVAGGVKLGSLSCFSAKSAPVLCELQVRVQSKSGRGLECAGRIGQRLGCRDLGRLESHRKGSFPLACTLRTWKPRARARPLSSAPNRPAACANHAAPSPENQSSDYARPSDHTASCSLALEALRSATQIG